MVVARSAWLLAMLGATVLCEHQTTEPDQAGRQQLLRTVENGLIKLFGFSKRPQIKNKVHIPPYMLDLYRTHVSDPENIQLNLQVKGQSVYTANTARSFFLQEQDDARASSNNHTVTLQFNVSSLPSEELMTAAELRIYREKLTSVAGVKPGEKFRIDVYDILRPATKSREAFTRLLDTKTVSSGRSAWESLDVQPAVVRWKRDPRANHGLQLHSRPVKSSSGPVPHSHVRLKRSADQSERSWLQHQPLLVTYSDDRKYERTKRSNRKNKRRRTPRPNKNRRKRDLCRRHELYVDFGDVGWTDWIVAPPGYKAYFCQGECRFPIADHLNTTNHAVIQTLVNSVNPTAVPRACCIPTKLRPISMLYIDEENRVVLKNYADMVVEGCGCQ